MANEIRNYIFGIIVFVAFIMGGVGLLAELRESDTSFATDERFTEFNNTFNVYDDLKTETGKMQTAITNTNSTDFGTFGVLNSLISSVWQSLRLMFSSVEFMETAITGVVIFGVPAWIPALAITAIGVMITFAIIAYVFKAT